MNLLELCQETAKKCSITGTLVDVATATGELSLLVGWVNEAWYDIQLSKRDWDWMQEDFSFNTVAATQEYSVTTIGLTNFSRWLAGTLRIRLTSLTLQDEQFIVPWDFNVFRDVYMYGIRNQGRPTVFAIRPKGNGLLFGLTPDDVYTVTGQYQRKSAKMTVANASTPDMPEEYHMAIVHKARMKYAAFESAPEVMAEAMFDYDAVMSQLRNTHTEEFSFGAPLA